MKRFIYFFISIGITFTVNAAQKPAQQIKAAFIQDYATLAQKTAQLADYGKAESGNQELAESYFFAARNAYKKIEWLFNYLDHEFVKDHINGAPLPQIERKAPSLVIFDPVGFQTMEEALVAEDYEAFYQLGDQLHIKIEEFQRYLPALPISERMLFEALREETIRLTAMGITGFDTPSGINTMHECKIVFQTMDTVLNYYEPYLDPKENKTLTTLFKKGESYFSADFDQFDRFGFIRHFADPFYKKLVELQLELHIPTRDLAVKSVSSLNYKANSMFETNFLNDLYFSKYSNAGKMKERKALGKMLFFDPILSKNNKRACASCHHPEKAFSDGKVTSLAFDGNGVLKRNAPGLINVVFNTRLFWDARAEAPEDQIEHVLFNPHEFNTNYEEMIEKLNTCETYVEQFETAYPETDGKRMSAISRYTIVASISAYVQSLKSTNSPFDQVMRDPQAEQDQRLKAGFNLFAGKANCATCHFIPTFAGNVPPLYKDTETEVLGVPDTNDQLNAVLDDDLGRYENGRPKERAEFLKNSFKTPTVRNVALTAPYMHNGVFNTLEEVVEFYNVGGGHGWGIAPANTTLPEDSLHLTKSEIADLVYFMENLTDTTGLTSKPQSLPQSTRAALNSRKIGGLY